MLCLPFSKPCHQLLSAIAVVNVVVSDVVEDLRCLPGETIGVLPPVFINNNGVTSGTHFGLALPSIQVLDVLDGVFRLSDQ